METQRIAGIVMLAVIPLALLITTLVFQFEDMHYTGSDDFVDKERAGTKHSLTFNVAFLVWFTPAVLGSSAVLIGYALCLHPKIWGDSAWEGVSGILSTVGWLLITLYSLTSIFIISYTFLLVNFDPQFCGDITSGPAYFLWFGSQAFLVNYFILPYLWTFFFRDMTIKVLRDALDWIYGPGTMEWTYLKSVMIVVNILLLQLFIVYFYHDATEQWLDAGRHNCGRPATLRLNPEDNYDATDFISVRFQPERLVEFSDSNNQDDGKRTKSASAEWWGVFSNPINTLLLQVAVVEIICYFSDNVSLFSKNIRYQQAEQMEDLRMESKFATAFGGRRRASAVKRARGDQEVPTVGYANGSK